MRISARSAGVQCLYKYLRPGHRSIEDILAKNRIYFPSREKLNDPFDCRPFIPKPSPMTMRQVIDGLVDYTTMPLLGEERARLRRELAHTLPDDFIDDLFARTVSGLGVCSLSLSNEILPMWAHYADNHKGICIAFNVRGDENDLFGDALSVEYTDIRPTVGVREISPRVYERISDSTADRIFLQKASVWAHESEYRIIHEQANVHVDLPAGALAAVYIGAAASDDVVRDVRAHLFASGRDIPLLKAELDQRRFGLRFRALNR